MRAMHRSRQALFFLASMLACMLAQAANLQISPVMINFRASQSAAGINLQNYGETPLYGQVRVYTWDQQNGEDVLAPATEVVASPPIMEIGPRSSQTIRLVRRTGPAAVGEQSYRILIDEIPRGDGPENGVAIRLQYSVPLFVLPADDLAAPALTWTVFRKNGDWTLRVQNAGTLHAQIGATSIRTASGKEYELSKGLLGYALPGKTREWRLSVDKAAALAGPLAIRASVNAKAVTTTGAVAKD
jgi:fimbrial chaperone protein